TTTSTVPTLLNREGDFSDLRTSAGQLVPIYDPVTHLPFASNVIPRERIDPVAFAAVKFYPLPNRRGTLTNANNFVGNNASSLDRDIVVAKIDHQVRPIDLLTVRYYLNGSGTETSGSWGNALADPDSDITSARIHSLTAAYTHVFGPSVVNQIRFTYLRRRFVDQ